MKDTRYRLVVCQLSGPDLGVNEQSCYMPSQEALFHLVRVKGDLRRQGFKTASVPRWDCALLTRADAEIEVKLEREVRHEPAH